YSNHSASCQGTFDEEINLITSPNYPNNYNGGESCLWLIQSRDQDRAVTLTFEEFT
ncbi:hypothetical protein Ciccas_013937, partial [Cichlidogyrus casuarinus]